MSKNTEAQEKAGLDHLFGNMHVDESNFGTQWTYVQHFSVFRINQDSSWQEVFRDSTGSFYATTKLPDMPSVAQQELVLEQSGLNRRIRDIHGNDYRMLEWHEIRDLTWKGNPFLYEPATSTARPGEDGFSGPTKKPSTNATFSASTTDVNQNLPGAPSTSPIGIAYTLMSHKDEEGTCENDLVRGGRTEMKFNGRAFIGP